MIVLNASAVVELVLGLAAGPTVASRISSADESLHAPHLLPVEVAQVVRRFERRGDIDEKRSAVALADLADFDIAYYELVPFLSRVWELRHNLTAYDALYVALAETLDATLLTTDGRLRGAPDHHATVEVLGAG